MLPHLPQIHLQGELGNSFFRRVQTDLQSQHKRLQCTFIINELGEARQQDTLISTCETFSIGFP